MLSFNENVSRTYEMKNRDVRIRTKHHDIRSQKALVFISGEVILIISSHCSLGWQYHLKLEVLTFLLCLRMVLAVCGHLLPYSIVLYCESIVHFLILTMIVKIAPIFRIAHYLYAIGEEFQYHPSAGKTHGAAINYASCHSGNSNFRSFPHEWPLTKEILSVSYYFLTISIQHVYLYFELLIL